ncbi:MAG: head GIN domain-containing protein [Flavihumibacter sp.]
MKKAGLFCLLLLMMITAGAQKFVISDAHAELRPTAPFTGVRISSAIDLYLSQGDETGVAVSAEDPAVRDRIKTEVKDGELHIWFDGQNWKNWRGNKNMKAYVSVKTIESLKASGASDIKLMGKIRADKLAVDLGGASDLNGELECKTLEMDISGASDLTISGNIGATSMRLRGASSVKSWGLATDYCEVDVSGASSVNVIVNKELNVKASGASDVRYKGDGVIKEMKTSGASSVSKK